tara:strand:- start:135 stop:1001 length:867 start_codon:yes stop_codon:yes gene_type:complete
MGNKIRMTESNLINMISKIVKEQRAGFGYGFMPEQVDEEGVDIMSTLDQNESWSKLKQFFKEYYTNVKTKVADVSPSEFNEIEMVLDAVVSLAREINLNNKSPEVIAQQLKRHMKDLLRMSNDMATDMESNKPSKEAPPLEEGRKLFRRLKNRMDEDSHYGMNKGDRSRTRPGEEDYTGHKGDISKTHKGRDYEGDDKQMIIDVLGKPRTVKELISNYTDMYNRADDEWKRDLPSIEEVNSVGMKAVEDNGGDDDDGPVAMIVWWLLGIGVALAWRRWGPGGYGDWPW